MSRNIYGQLLYYFVHFKNKKLFSLLEYYKTVQFFYYIYWNVTAVPEVW